MVNRSFGRVLSNLVAVSMLAIMALTATSALAVEFQIAGKAALLATATASQEGKAVLLVPGRNLKLECSSSDILAGTEILNATQALAKIRLLGCETFQHKAGTAVKCTVDNPEFTATISPATHSGGKYLLAVPDESTSFGTILLLGAECVLPEENPVKGSIVALIDSNGAVKPLLLFSELFQLLAGDTLTFGGFSSYVSGSAVVELTGGHAGLGVEVVPSPEEEKEALEAETKALEAEVKALEEIKTGIFVIDGGKVLLAGATASQEGKVVLLVPLRNLKLGCSSSDIRAGTEILNATQALAKIRLLGCETFSHKTGAAMKCTVDNPEFTATVSPAAHSGGKYVLAVPDESTSFGTVLLLGEECPLPEENPVKGSIVALIDDNGKVKPLLLFSEAIQLLVGDKLIFGGFSSYVSGSAVVELTGGHAGLRVEVAG